MKTESNAGYLVPDVLAPGLKVVFCGTALGHVSAREKAYYANPGNQFWSTLHRTGITPRKLAPKEYPEVLNLRIGLTDLCKRHYGNDHELPGDAFDRESLWRKMERWQPDFLAFTSKTGAQLALGRAVEYGVQPERIARTRVYVCCSPSGRARRFWREAVWEELARLIVQGVD